jgi:hypothetical protein
MTNPAQSTPVEKSTPSTLTPAAGNKIEPVAAKVEPAPAKAEAEPANKA